MLGDYQGRLRLLTINRVAVEKVPNLMLVPEQGSRYKRARVRDAAVNYQLGGLLLMMGHHSRSESLFYDFRIEDQVPENHLLRLIERHVSFQFVRDELRDSYSEARPSVDRPGSAVADLAAGLLIRHYQ